MSSEVTRRGAVLAALGVLAGCGFAPALGRGSAALALQNAVAVDTPDSVRGFQLREAIADRIGQGARFRLEVTLDERQEAATVTQEGDIARFQLIGRADWRLTEGDALRASGVSQGFTSFAATGSTVATQAAAADAGARLAVILADTILADLTLAAGGWG